MMNHFLIWIRTSWFALLVPTSPSLKTIAEREQARKRQLLSIVLLMHLASWIFFIFVIFFTGIGGIAQQSINFLTVGTASTALWINRCGYLKCASLFYFSTQFFAIIATISILASSVPFTCFFSWIMFLMLSVAAGLFVPAWGSLLLAVFANIFMCWFILVSNQHQFAVFVPDPTIRIALLLVIMVLILYMSLLSTISAITNQKAIIRADRAIELEQANQALTQAYADLEAAHVTIQQQALTDALTGLLNHRAVLEQLGKEIEQARCFSLLFFDADRFKRINDTYGHAVGDLVLCHIAERTRSILRSSDTLGRFGGEEFVVLLPETDVMSARVIAEHIRVAILSQAVTHSEIVEGITTTVSIGVATYPDDGQSEQELLAQADKAMYVAKELGRNQVCIAKDVQQMSADRDIMALLQLMEKP